MRRALPWVIACLLPAGVALAWTPIGPGNPAWQTPVPFKLNERGSSDLDIDTVEREVVRAMLDWSRVECTSLVANYEGRTPEDPAAGKNTIGWMESGWPAGPGTLGITSPQMSFFPASSIVSASMWLNGQDHTWVVGGGGFGTLDTYSIVLHEGGHYYGLGHTTVPGSTMVAAYSGGTFSLSSDDIEGICTLYPGDGQPRDCSVTGCEPGLSCVAGVCQAGPAPSGCQSDAECTAGELCSAGACSPAPAPAGCQGDAECAAGETCSAGACVGAATPDATCPGGCAVGERCESGACMPEALAPPTATDAGCSVDADCALGAFCMSGTCVGSGAPPAPVAGGAAPASLPATALGVGEECTFDADCRSGMCQVQGVQTVCTSSCSSHLDCGPGMLCDLSGAPPTCLVQAGSVPVVVDPLAPISSHPPEGAGGGCNVAAAGADTLGGGWLTLAALLLARRRSRTRRARSSPG